MKDDYSEPEKYWCSYCGRDIWVVVTKLTPPEALICNKCLEKKREGKLENHIRNFRK